MEYWNIDIRSRKTGNTIQTIFSTTDHDLACDYLEKWYKKHPELDIEVNREDYVDGKPGVFADIYLSSCLFLVYKKAATLEKELLADSTEEEAFQYCENLNWQITDENGFVWDLGYKRQSERSKISFPNLEIKEKMVPVKFVTIWNQEFELTSLYYTLQQLSETKENDIFGDNSLKDYDLQCPEVAEKLVTMGIAEKFIGSRMAVFYHVKNRSLLEELLRKLEEKI